MNRNILSQGDLDGACFLYSIANAYIALSHEKPNNSKWNDFLKRWDHATEFIPFLRDFFSSTKTYSGSGRYNKYEKLFESTIEVLLRELTRDKPLRFAVMSHPDITEKNEISDLIDENSVVFTCSDEEHWVCCVASEKKKIYCACSYEFIRPKRNEYAENHHKDFNRYSNTTLKGKPSCVYQIRIK